MKQNTISDNGFGWGCWRTHFPKSNRKRRELPYTLIQTTVVKKLRFLDFKVASMTCTNTIM